MSDVFIIEALRTPFGSFGGNLSDVPAPQLGATVVRELLAKTGVAPDQVGQFIAGQVIQAGVGQAPARQAMRAAGIPDGVPAMTINKVCGSGLKAIMLAADSIRLGDDQLAIAGGMENMSLVPYALPKARYGMRMGNATAIDLMIHDALWDPYSGRHMGEVTEETVARLGISREDQDEFAIDSYRRAQNAVKEGLFVREIAPVCKKTRKGDVVISEDEDPFRVDFDRFTSLRPAFRKDGTLTAGNASTIADGASFVMLASGEAVAKYGLQPRARLVAYATNSLHPDNFPEAPVGAIERACTKAGLTAGQVDLFEINEAFAAVTMIAIRKLGLDRDRVNINGGACAIGHPVGASGARLVTTLLNGLEQRQQRYGLATLCIGGGEAVSAIVERV
ncbi:acetyl-CoA C-acyltransferase [Geothermobacter hydrogeniphilus]|uniref:Acetyl-CoA C-acyltransferase n=1 Tax=Geothermobacter hydrogeniphilus TaxID=1969733 RepID=A0A2K2HA45_9BACT|nr:thiolase family protein [Geothermobacter hydrogeniphilus]PNU20184.1 acetyl-CoA C-acyltransferase [Geothermobacter hydrogeniphilus]